MLISSSKKRKLSFISIYFTFVLDNFGWALAVPVFAPLFIDVSNVLFAPEISIGTRTIILGVFLGAFPIAQFVGAPLIGEYADKKGRKKAFIFSIALTVFGYALSAWSIKEHNLGMLFLSRIITGLFAGNLSICLASIADLSKGEKAKAQNFGYLSMFAGLSFILGTFLGGKLSDSSINSFFNPAFPLWIATALCFLNLLFIIFYFTETVHPHGEVHYKFLKSFSNIYKALKVEKIKKIYLIYFLFYLSWNFLFQFGPVLMIKRFAFSYSQIGDLAAFMGLCWAFGTGVVNKFLLSKLSKTKVLELALLILILPYGLIGFFKLLWLVILIMGLCSILGGIAWPLFNSILSDRVAENRQGKVLGINQSMQSLATAFAPMISGVFVNFSIAIPFVIAAVMSLTGVTIYIKGKV